MKTETRTSDQGQTYLMVERTPGKWQHGHNPTQCQNCNGTRVLFLDPYYDVTECTGTCGHRRHHPIGE